MQWFQAAMQMIAAIGAAIYGFVSLFLKGILPTQCVNGITDEAGSLQTRS